MTSKKNTKILVVEDNTEVRENIAEILELDGYETLTAKDGKEGVMLSRTHMPDLILCDIMMPNLDGYGMLKIVKKDERLKRIPFIFLTAKSEKQDFRRGMSMGADDFLMKPFDDVDLLESIETRLSRSTSTSLISSFWNRGMKREEINNGINKLRSYSQKKIDRVFQPKEHIYKAGEHALYLFFVKKGVLKTSTITDSGKEMISCLYKENDLLGVVPCLLDGGFNETCTALTEAEIELIPVSECEDLIREDANFLIALSFILAHQTAYFSSRSADLAYSSVRKKVANALLLYREAFAQDQFPCLREDLSCLATIAKETLIRTLSDFKKEGLIHTSLHDIEILRADRLEDLSL